MKKIIILLFLVVLTGCTIPIPDSSKTKNNTNPANLNSEGKIFCETSQDCIDSGMICIPTAVGSIAKKPICSSVSLATGERHPVPFCICINPKLDY